jgi:hypothetical protein
MSDSQAALNTDRELWRKTGGDYYSPRIYVNDGGGIGIDVGGTVYVKSVEAWHALACADAERAAQSPQPAPIEVSEHHRCQFPIVMRLGDKFSCYGCGKRWEVVWDVAPQSPKPAKRERDAVTSNRGKVIENRAHVEGTVPDQSDRARRLAIDIACELYDRFVMGGWEPQDVHKQLESQLAEYASSVNAALQRSDFQLRSSNDSLRTHNVELKELLRAAESKCAELFDIKELMRVTMLLWREAAEKAEAANGTGCRKRSGN